MALSFFDVSVLSARNMSARRWCFGSLRSKWTWFGITRSRKRRSRGGCARTSSLQENCAGWVVVEVRVLVVAGEGDEVVVAGGLISPKPAGHGEILVRFFGVV